MGAVLQQRVDDAWFPLAFYSKKLSDAERKYSAFDRELLAAYSAIRHFRFMIEGREFLLFTDHKPLTHALFKVSPPWTARQQRHLAFIAEYTSSILHVPGLENTVADALSRPVSSSAPSPNPKPEPVLTPVSSSAPSPHLKPEPVLTPQPVPSALPSAAVLPKSPQPLSVPCSSVLDPAPSPAPNFSDINFDISQISPLQQSCPSVAAMKTSTSLSLVSVPISSGSLLCDDSTGVLRPLVPESLRKPLFLALHSISHPGVRGSRRLISARFVWPGLARDVGVWSRACLQCQRSKIQTHV